LGGDDVHPAANVCDVPAGQVGEALRFELGAHRKGASIAGRRIARLGPCPWMAQHVPPLEVRAVGGLLEHEVFREMRGVVSHVETRDEYVAAAAPGQCSATFEPEDTKLTELGRRQRFGGARI